MSKGQDNTSLTIIRSTHLARDAVLFSLVGVFSMVYYPETMDTNIMLLWLLLDLIGLVLFWIPKELARQIGFAWAIMMSLALFFPVFTYFGMGYFVGGLVMILLLCIIELLALVKIGYEVFIKDVHSWTNDTE